MTQTTPIDFWFSIGSLYTYLTVMRIDRVEELSDVTFRWRPFSVRAIMIEMDNRPVSKPAKLDYMWRDLSGGPRCISAIFHAVRPTRSRTSTSPTVSPWSARAKAGARTTRARPTRAGSAKARNPAASPTCRGSLREIGQDPARVLALAQSDAIGRAYDAATAEAKSLGIFGAPTFVTGGEMFWGDDRLDDAMRWHRHGVTKLR